jgi:hypothetical protein
MTLDKKRRLTAIVIAASFLTYGFIAEIGLYRHWQDYPGLVFAILEVLLLFTWYRFDSEIVGFRRNMLLNALILFFAALGAPLYIFMSRGLRRGSIVFGQFLLFVFGVLLLAYAGALLAYGTLLVIT